MSCPRQISNWVNKPQNKFSNVNGAPTVKPTVEQMMEELNLPTKGNEQEKGEVKQARTCRQLKIKIYQVHTTTQH